MIILGKKPNQVDLLNFLDGVDFDEAWPRRVEGKLGESDVSFIGLTDYIATKKASGRPKDVDDLNRLREHLGCDFPA